MARCVGVDPHPQLQARSMTPGSVANLNITDIGFRESRSHEMDRLVSCRAVACVTALDRQAGSASSLELVQRDTDGKSSARQAGWNGAGTFGTCQPGRPVRKKIAAEDPLDNRLISLRDVKRLREKSYPVPLLKRGCQGSDNRRDGLATSPSHCSSLGACFRVRRVCASGSVVIGWTVLWIGRGFRKT